MKHHLLRLFISLVQEERPDKRFESVAASGLGMGIRKYFNQVHEVHPTGQQPELFTLHQFRPHFGELSFSLIGEFLEEVFGHDRVQDSVAQVFKALVVERVAVSHRFGGGTVDKCCHIQRDIGDPDVQNRPQVFGNLLLS